VLPPLDFSEASQSCDKRVQKASPARPSDSNRPPTDLSLTGSHNRKDRPASRQRHLEPPLISLQELSAQRKGLDPDSASRLRISRRQPSPFRDFSFADQQQLAPAITGQHLGSQGLNPRAFFSRSTPESKAAASSRGTWLPPYPTTTPSQRLQPQTPTRKSKGCTLIIDGALKRKSLKIELGRTRTTKAAKRSK